MTQWIKECYIWQNGNVMCFDSTGAQISECQGFIFDVMDKVKKHSTKDTKFSFGEWGRGVEIKCDFSWWYEREHAKNQTKESMQGVPEKA